MTSKKELKSTGTGYSNYSLMKESLRCKVLPTIVKSVLILRQTNAESECSQSVNTKVVTKNRVSLNEMLVFML